MALFSKGLSALSSLALAACAFLPSHAPTDLRFEAARAILSKEANVDVQRYNHKSVPVLEVSFSSGSDLFEFANDNDNIGYSALACSDWQKNEEYNKRISETGSSVKAGPYVALMNNVAYDVYYGDIPVKNDAEAMRRYNALPEVEKSKRPLMYQIYLDVRREPYTGHLAANVQSPPTYDLQKNPEDVCFHIGGGRMWIGGATPSNIVTIPKEAIATALRGSK